MARYAIVDSGTVANIVEWDGRASHPDSAKFVLADAEANAQIGATYDGSTFSYTAPTYTLSAAEQALIDNRASAKTKLIALGLTADECRDTFGI